MTLYGTSQLVRSMKYEIIRNKKGEKDVYGIFRPEGMDFGKNGIRKKLCTRDDLVYKQTKSGKRKRSDREQDLFLRKLWEQKLKEIVDGKEKSPPGMSFKQAAQLFLDERSVDLQPSSIEGYTHTFNTYLDIIGNHSITNLKPIYRSKFIASLDRMKPNTINKHFALLNCFLKWCEDNELLAKPYRFKRVKTEAKRRVAYSLDHQLAIEQAIFKDLEASKGTRYHQRMKTLFRAYMMVCETGMRIGEIYGLKLSRINLESGMIEVRSTPELGMHIKEWREKNVPISGHLRGFLKGDIEDRGENEVWYLDSGLGTPFYRQKHNITWFFSEFLKKHNLKHNDIKPFHGFRASVISRIAEKKGIEHAKQIAGHSKISTTELYVDPDILELTEAVDLLRIPSQFPVGKTEG